METNENSDKPGLEFVCPNCGCKDKKLGMIIAKTEIYDLENLERDPDGTVRYGMARKSLTIPRGHAYFCQNCNLQFQTIESAFYNV